MDCSRTLSLLALAVVVGAPVPSGAGRTTGDASQLLRVVTPVTGRTVPAHPFVNVVVRTGAGPADPVDPRSFRAHLGGRSITRLFIPIVDDGAVVGMRALLGAALLARGDRLNHLRVEVRGRGKGRRASHAVAHVVFRTATAPDRAPRARLLVSSDLVSGGAPLQFDGTESDDPDLDTLAYRWDFGDGTTSADPRPAHTYTTTAPSVTVRLTVSDGQLAASDRLTLLAAPALDPGRTPGVLAVDASQPLEFGGVAIGSQASLTFTVRNAGTAPTSQLKVALDACTHVWATGECDDGGPFALSTSSLDLGPGEAAPVELTFASAAGGHRSAQVTLVASASNAGAVHLLAHANGGPGSGPGPLPAASTLFFGSEVAPIEASLPGGERLAIDDVLGGCTVPQNGPGSGDACVVDADCGAHGGRCGGTGACVGGARPGDACAAPDDCPGGSCSAVALLDPIDIAGDGAGGVYVLADESYTDPDPNDPIDLSGTLVHLDLDGAGNRLGAEILARTSSFTTQMATDALAAPAGGHLYLARYQPVTGPRRCLRSGLEQLVAVRKSDGGETVLAPRIDAAEGLDPCLDEYDSVNDVEVARDGSQIFVGLPNGIYRIWPSVLLMTPDQAADGFTVHPDGTLLIVAAEDRGRSGLLRVYKLPAGQAANGAPLLGDLMPCATIEVPNDLGPGISSATVATSMAVAPVTPGSTDGTVVLAFASGDGGGALSPALRPQGTFAISSPAGSDTCAVLGLVDVEPLGQLAF